MKLLEVENKKVNWKYISAVILLATLAGASTLVYCDRFPIFSEIPLATRRTKPIEPIEPELKGWRVFTNNELGFSFKYPAKWGDVEERIWDGNVSGRQYDLRFANFDICSLGKGHCAYATGKSIDFGAPRDILLEDYSGDPDKPKQVNVSTSPIWGTVPNYAQIDFNLPGKEISGVRLFIPILSISDKERFNKECSSEDLGQKKGICVYYHYPEGMTLSFHDMEEDMNIYLKDLGNEELDSTSQEMIEIFKEILNSSKVF